MNLIKKSTKSKETAKKIIHRRMLYAAGLGLIPIPIVDAAVILSTQILMLKDIAEIYRIPFKGQAAKSMIGALVGSLGTAGIIKIIPGLGSLVGGAAMSITGGASTYAVGKIFTLHFEQGGTLLDFDPIKSRKHFEQAYREGEIRSAAIQEANKGKLSQVFQANNNADFKLSEDKSIGVEKMSEREFYITTLKKLKRKKALKAKKRRKARFRKLISRGLFYGVLIALFNLFYSKYLAPRFNLSKDALQSNEIELFLKENEAKQIKLDPFKQLDSLIQVQITSFSPVSTEGVISQYIQNPNSSYPKRYALNAVRFTGTSEKLSSGAKEQLMNIGLLLKKYPDLLVNIYGHTGSKGPVFNRQRIGRDRARVLKEVFVEQGIPSYRITGNYIEKQQGTSEGYWGAEVVLYVATIESVVEVAPPSLSIKENIFTSFAKTKKEAPKIEEESKIEEKPKTKEEPKIEEAPVFVDSSISQLEADTQQEAGISEITPQVVDTQQEATIPETIPQIIDTIEEEKTIVPSPQEPKIEAVPDPPKPAPEETKPKPERKIVTIEGVMQQYIESPNPKYPKIFSLPAITFKGESTNINEKGIAQLNKIAVLMKKNAKIQVKINGHAAGKTRVNTQEEKNQFLLKWQGIGQKRARVIKKSLRDQGIANKRIKTGFTLKNQGEDTRFWGADLVIEHN